MATVLEEYLVKFGFDTKLEGVDRMVGLLKSSKELFSSIREPFDAFNQALTALGTITSTITKPIADVINMTTQTALAANELNDSAKRLGVASEDLERFGYVADMSGSSAESMNQALFFLNKEMANAASGNKESIKTFTDLGVKLTDVNGKTRETGAVMQETLAAIAKIEDPAKKNAAALSVFSKSAFDIKGVLENDAQALADLNAEFEVLGGPTSQKLIAQGAELDDSFNRIKRAVDSFKRSFTEGIMPAFNGFTKWVEKFLKENGPGIRRFFETLGTIIATMADVAGGALDTFYQALKHVFDNFEVYGTILAIFKAKSIAAAVASGAAWAIANAPLLLTIAAVLLAIVALEDFFGFLQGKDSVIGDIVAHWDEWSEKMREISPILGYIMDALGGVGRGIMAVVEMFRGLLAAFQEGGWSAVWKEITASFDTAVTYWKNTFMNFLSWLGEVFTSAGGAIWAKLTGGLKSLAGSLGIDIGGGTGAAASIGASTSTVSNSMMSSSSSKNTTNQVSAPITIQATPGMNERELATQVEQRFQEMFRSEVRSSYPDVAYSR